MDKETKDICPFCGSEDFEMIGDPEYNDMWRCKNKKCDKEFGSFKTVEVNQDNKKIPYNQIDHSHCWNQPQPPACGLKTPHKRCCLCEVQTPETPEWVKSFREEFCQLEERYGITRDPELLVMMNEDGDQWKTEAVEAFIRKTLALEREKWEEERNIKTNWLKE